MKTPYWLASPAILFYSVFLVTPLIITFLLSFHGYSLYTGVTSEYNLLNYKEVLTDDYFYTIFARTFFMSIIVVLFCTVIAVIESLLLYKMSIFWKSVSLLIILGPLLVSVIVRTLGWALILGENGLISNIPVVLGLSKQPISFMYTEAGVIIALIHVLVPFSIISVWASMGKLDYNTIEASLSLKAS
ncbi:MAG: hypothetical protein L3J44_08650, partial [Campylobacteraceae bacterium]|nr:hypothetical protein [Campylobacteraceae bacterium]